MAVGQRGWLTMDAEISRDGSLLYFANARFTGGTVPVEADLSVARRVQGAFSVLDDSRAILANLNSRALVLYYHRLEGSEFAVFRAERAR